MKQGKPVGSTMTRDHPHWKKFCKRLAGPEGCDFKEKGWRCNSRSNRPYAVKILKDMNCNVAASLRYFDQHGGYCDCEILFNVDRHED